MHLGVPLAPLGHTLPHAPQLSGSSLTCLSQPVSAAPSQSAQSVLQRATRHDSVEHSAEAFGSMHTSPHAPQLASVASELSHPFDATRSQSPQLASQVNPQAPDAQTRVEFATDEHTPPQRPQLSTLVAMLTHAALQSSVPVGHVDTHTPAAHALPEGHALPQRPQ